MVQTPNTQTIEVLAKRILEADTNVRTSVLIKAELISDAISQLGDEYEQDLAERISMTPATLSRWKAIGSNTIIKKNTSVMPSAMGSLYAVTVLETVLDKNHGVGTGEDRIQRFIDGGQLSSVTPRSFIEGKIKEQNDLSVRRKSKENEKKIEALVTGQSISNPSTLKDFIDRADLFHTIVVVPSSEQITEWKKLDFPVDIGDVYPIHEIRKTTQTAPVLCFVLIRRNLIDLGIDCLKGWGFSYRNVVAPNLSEDVLLVGARGTFSEPIHHSKDVSIPEILGLAETSGKSPRILIGEKTDRKSWTICNG